MRHISIIFPIAAGLLVIAATTQAQVGYQGQPGLNPYSSYPSGGSRMLTGYDTTMSPGGGAITGSVISDTVVSQEYAPVGAGAPVDYRYEGEVGTAVGGFSTTPGYPRNQEGNPAASSSPEPSTEYPETREEALPERIGRTPPITPFPQQETYSYNTETYTSNSSACQLCGEGYGNPYLWQFRAGAGLKHRQRAESGRPMFFDSTNTETYGMVAADTDFPMVVGLDTGVTRYLGRTAFNYDMWCDFHFDGLYQWKEELTFVPMNAYYSDFGMAGLTTYPFDPDTGTEETTAETWNSVCSLLDMKCTSTMNMGEIMLQVRKRGRPDPMVCHPNGRWTRECQGGLRYTHTLGMRFISYNDEVSWKGTSAIYDAKNVLQGYEYGFANVDVQNSLLGFSFGGSLVDKRCVWSWGMSWRVSPFLNFMENKIHLSDSNGNVYMTKADETDVGYQVEYGIFTTYKILPHAILRIGYDIGILGNLATANNSGNMDALRRAQVKGSEYLMFQSISASVNFVW